jgi:CRISP-associated protein Cas1
LTTLLNTLFVTAEGAQVHRDHETLVVRVEHEIRMRIPLLHVGGIVVFGSAWVSPEAMHSVIGQGGAVSFLSPTGKFLSRVEGIPGGSVQLRRAQFRASESDAITLEVSRSFVAGKIFNGRALVQRAAREASDSDDRATALGSVVEELQLRLREVERVETLEALRGLEGLAARQYWGVFDLLIKKQREAFRFTQRSRRPPGDRVNALLSFGYAILVHDCVAGCGATGLDPAVGFLHEDRPGRLSLALDLMEELRVPVVDRLVLALINREQVTGGDLVEDPVGGWTLTKNGRKTFVTVHDHRG